MFLTALLLIAGQAGGPLPQPPASSPEAPATPAQYQVGPDDILKVTVYGHDDLTLVVVVQSDGTFTYPLIGRVKAADLTPKELERKITTLLSQRYVRNPQVTVLVQEYRSKTVVVMGEVAHPGSFPLSGVQTLVDILARAGPMTANAGAEVLIVRPLASEAGPLPSGLVEQAALGE